MVAPLSAADMFSSTSSTMFTSAANLVSVARSKLNSSPGSGSRDNLSLHRWVLLKNSIIRDDVLTIAPAPSPVSDSPAPDVEFDEDEEVDFDWDEGMFAFLFPDPGDAVASHDDGSVSEAQWLDSLLEKLADNEDDDSEPDYSVKVTIHPVEDDEGSSSGCSSPSSSYSDSLISPIAVPYPVPYPPIHPPLVDSFTFDSQPNYCFSCLPSNRDILTYHDLDDSLSSVPDAIEDTSDDESESPSTPFSDSRTSVAFVDPASIPLPRDQPAPIIYNASDEFFGFEVDPPTYPDSNSTPPLYSPYHQNC